MKYVFSLVCLVFSLSAGAENLSIRERKYDRRQDGYHDIHIGDHYEWSDYGYHYDKVNYGHVFEWDKPGLSAMSLCFEIDKETGGKKYRQLVDDEYCPTFETNYAWDNFIDGHPSRCLKQDKLTGGLRYSRIVDDKRCASLSSVYQWDAQGAVCWERDGETNGSKFRRKVDGTLCPRTLDVARAFGRKIPLLEAVPKSANRAPASIPAEDAADPKEFWEDPEDLVEHVHHAPDKIHHR